MGNFTLEETKQLINNKVKELRSKGVTENLRRLACLFQTKIRAKR